MAQKTVVFISKYASYTAVKRPARSQVIDGVVQTLPGERAEFSAGRYETDDKSMIQFLRKHPKFGIDFFEEQAELEPEPAPPAKTEPPSQGNGGNDGDKK